MIISIFIGHFCFCTCFTRVVALLRGSVPYDDDLPVGHRESGLVWENVLRLQLV